MNIGIDIRCLMTPHRTGVGEYTYELLNALFLADKENQYFLFYNSYKDVSEFIPKWNQDNVHFVSTKLPNKLFSLAQCFGFLKIDKIISNPPGELLSLRDSPSLQSPISNLDYFFSPNLNFTSVSKNTKHILTVHDLSFEFFKDCFSWKRRIWHKFIQPRKQCKHANIILTPSKNTKRDVIDYYRIDEDKVKVFYPGLSSKNTNHVSHTTYQTRVKEKYNLPEKFILYLGTLEPRKNIFGIIEAYKKSSLITDHCSLIIAGARGWNDKEILQQIEQTEGVKYIGYVDEKDKNVLYQLASLFIFPSLYEGFGFPVLEAMASGTPVVTSNRSSLPEVAGNAAYLVNPVNTAEISKGMEILLKNQLFRDKLAKKGITKASEFKWSKTAQNFLALLQK